MEAGHYDSLLRRSADGVSLRQLRDVDQVDLDNVYAYAYQLFEAGEYEAAKRGFYMLVRIDHHGFDYWLALGLSCQRLDQHDEAIFCFSRSGALRLTDPRSSYFAGISYQIVDNREYAEKAFNAALKWCASHQEYQSLRARVSRSLAAFQQEN